MATPAIVWRGTNGNNYYAGRDGQKVIAICDHIMAGSIESADSWFKSPGSQASAHFGVAKDGRIWQWVAEENAAWANGVVNLSAASPPWLVSAVAVHENPNNLTISIEHEGQPSDIMPEAQYQATLSLHRYLVAKYAIKLDREHIIGHYQVDAVNRPDCPGPNYPWKRLMSDLANGGTFDPNPRGLNVGPGMLEKLKQIKETSLTNEQFFGPNPGQPPGLAQRSFLWTDQGSMLIAFQDLMPDGKTPAPTWQVKQYHELP